MDERLFDIDFVNSKIYHYENIDRWRKITREYNKKRRKTDSQFKFISNMRSRLNIAFKKRKWNKDSTTSELLGGDLKQVMSHIESKFKQNMSWDNYGKWHIDHIIPLCSAKSPEEVCKLCHFSNLQPLWAKDNIKKRGN